jgi:light-regulated signal transduction histidine kinase (bacteriophytochrome)
MNLPPCNPERDAAEARALLTALTGFSERAGHDMAGPLNQAATLVSLFIKRKGKQLDRESDQLLDYLLGASERMEQAARGVRKFMEIAAKPLAWASVDLNEALAAARQGLRRGIVESGAEIESENLPEAMGDASQLAIVFENLLGNCIKFRRPEARPRVRIAAQAAGEEVAVSIRDDCNGIDPEDFEKLFVAFRRLNGREYPGPGLGLAIARMIVERHGGRIGMNPVTGSGTCVEFTVRRLPLST